MKLGDRARDRIVALALFLATAGWMLAVEGRQGIGRDEAQYMRAGQRYWAWFANAADSFKAKRWKQPFTRATIDPIWSDNPEHPPLMKVLYGVSWRLFRPGLPSTPRTAKGALPILPRDSTSLRLPAILVAGLGAALLYLFARRWIGRAAAAAAAICFVAQPHYFFHAQIAAFDAPITVMAFAVAYAYWKSLESARWGLLCGPIWGVALAVKHNAWLMPAFLLAHYLWMRRGDLRRLRPPRPPLAFVSMAVLGPLVAFALWPWLWPEPVARARWYFQRHMQHEHYNFEYLGRNWNLPPQDADLKLLRATFPFVSTAFTVPLTTLALAGIGAGVLLRRRRRPPGAAPVAPGAGAPANGAPATPPGSPDFADAAPRDGARPSWLRPGADVDRAPGAFVGVHVLGPMAVVALPSTPIFGGVKHFMPAMPFLALAAGVGAAWLLARTGALLRVRRRAVAALALAAAVPAVAETQRSHPDGLAHYNLLAGGFAGGATLGMNRQFWGYSVLPMLPWMNQNRPASRHTYWHDVLHDALLRYIGDGRLIHDIGDLGPTEDLIARSDLAIVVHEKHFALFENAIWTSYGVTQPAYVYQREGVPLVTAYRRPGAPGMTAPAWTAPTREPPAP